MKNYLFRKNISPKQFAADLDISTSYLYQLLRGERKPSLELAQKIEEYTSGELTVAKIMGIEKDEDPKTFEERLENLEAVSEKIELRLNKIEGHLKNLDK